MDVITTTSFQTIGLIAFIWILIGIVGYDFFDKYFSQLTKALDDVFSNFIEATLSLTYRLLKYYEATDIEIAQRINKNSDWNNIAQEVATAEIEQTDKPILANRIRIEKMIGSLLGFLGLAIVIYGSSLQGAMNLSTLFPQTTLPEIFNISVIEQMMVIIVGVAVSNGLYISDILGTTNFTNSLRFRRSNIQGRQIEKWMLVIRIFNLVSTIIIFIFITVKDSLLNNIGLSFLVIPLLTTAFTSFDIITGMNLILCIPLYMLSLSFSFTRYGFLFVIGFSRAVIHLLWILFDKTIGFPIKMLGRGNKE